MEIKESECLTIFDINKFYHNSIDSTKYTVKADQRIIDLKTKKSGVLLNMEDFCGVSGCVQVLFEKFKIKSKSCYRKLGEFEGHIQFIPQPGKYPKIIISQRSLKSKEYTYHSSSKSYKENE